MPLLYVPSSQDARYFSCFAVSLSIRTPIAFNLRRAVSRSISSGPGYTWLRSFLPLFTTDSTLSAWLAQLLSITELGWPSALARLIRRPSPRTAPPAPRAARPTPAPTWPDTKGPAAGARLCVGPNVEGVVPRRVARGFVNFVLGARVVDPHHRKPAPPFPGPPPEPRFAGGGPPVPAD